METLFRKAEELISAGEIIRDSLFEYNTGLCKKRVPLEFIQFDIALLREAYLELYDEVGKKRKENEA
jgi:hypothetical protein